MKINVKVFPKSKSNKIVFENDFYKIYISVVPEKRKANKKLIDLLSKHLDIPKSLLVIKKGIKSPYKIVEILENKYNKKGAL